MIIVVVIAEIGLEGSLDGHIQALVDVFREVWRVLRDDGTLWLNYGDAYAHNQKDRRWGQDGPRKGRANQKDKVCAKLVAL